MSHGTPLPPPPPPDSWVINLSSKQLSSPQKSVLARGLNFTPAPHRIPVLQMVAAVEDGLRQIDCSEADRVHTTAVGILNKARPPPMNISPMESRALKELHENDSIVIVPADKGQASVVMDRSDYNYKIDRLLSEQQTYQKLPRDLYIKDTSESLCRLLATVGIRTCFKPH